MRRFGLFAHRRTIRIVPRPDVSPRLISRREPRPLDMGYLPARIRLYRPILRRLRIWKHLDIRGRRSYSRDTALHVAQRSRVREMTGTYYRRRDGEVAPSLRPGVVCV